jgi:hypothetical protein
MSAKVAVRRPQVRPKIYTRPHPRDHRQLGDEPFALGEHRKRGLYLLHSHHAALRLRRIFGREQQQSGIALDTAISQRHIENLLEIPSQMIHDGKRKAGLRLPVEQILQLIAPEAPKLPVLKATYEMNRNTIHVVLPR